MMSIPLTGPSYIYVDNRSVIHNKIAPKSTLKKIITLLLTILFEKE